MLWSFVTVKPLSTRCWEDILQEVVMLTIRNPVSGFSTENSNVLMTLLECLLSGLCNQRMFPSIVFLSVV